MLAFLALASTSKDSKTVAITGNYSFCIFTTGKEKCPEDSKEFFDGNTPNFAKKFKSYMTKKHPDNFTGITVFKLYIDYREEDQNPITIDLMNIKNPEVIQIIGINDIHRSPFILNSEFVATYDEINLKHVKAIKQETTEFYIKVLRLENITLSGFQKATVFYGYDLYTDMLSIANCTFKFDNLYYSINQTEPFLSNYYYDGAIFIDKVVFKDFPNGCQIYQYGDQFIIIPRSIKDGIRKTQFRLKTNKNISYSFEITNSNVSFGCYFSNRFAAFTDIYVQATNSNLTILKGYWHGYEKMGFQLVNSNLTVLPNSFAVYFKGKSVGASVIADAAFKIPYGRSDEISGIKFTNKRITFEVFEIVNYTEPIEITSDTIALGTLISDKVYDTVSFIGDSTFDLQRINAPIKNIEIGNLDHGYKLTITKFRDFIPCITIKNHSSYFRSPFTLVGENPVLTEDTVIIKYPSNNRSVYPHKKIFDAVFPVSVVWLEDENHNSMLAISAADYDRTRTSFICISDDGSSNCNSEEKVFKTELTSLQAFLDYIEIENASKLNFNFFIDTSTPILIDNKISKVNKLYYTGLRPDSSVKFVSKYTSSYLKLENITFDIDPKISKLDYFSVENVNFTDNFKNAVTYIKYFDIDDKSWEPICRLNMTFNRITVQTYRIYFSGTTLQPYIAPKCALFVRYSKVGLVQGSGGFSPIMDITIFPLDKINFTTNNYGNLTLKMLASREDQVIDVYFKAFFPVELKANKGVTINLHPHFYGDQLKTARQLCAENVNIDTDPSVIVIFANESYNCKKQFNVDVKSDMIMEAPKFNGVADLGYMVVEKEMSLGIDTYLTVERFGNPNDEFMLFFDWSLRQMPMMRIKEFTSRYSRIFDPFMGMYPKHSLDVDELLANKEIFKFGIPILCIEKSDYIGTMGSYGTLYIVNGTQPNTTSAYSKIGIESDPDVCLTMLPYIPQEIPKPRIGPERKGGWIVLIAISLVILIAIIVSTLISFFCAKGHNTTSNNILGATE